MLSKIEEQSSTKICIQASSKVSTINIQSSQSFAPTLYDYLSLLPLLISAATPLILGLRNKKFVDSGRPNPKDNDSSEVDKANSEDNH